jgi:acylphosphatase
MSDERVRAHVFVSGTVQGVYYRASTRDAARERDVDGWVRNLDDGRVEAVFEGPEGAVEEMVEWCETGSSAASVDDVSVEYESPEGESGFRVRY